jgi:hypothetical protein
MRRCVARSLARPAAAAKLNGKGSGALPCAPFVAVLRHAEAANLPEPRRSERMSADRSCGPSICHPTPLARAIVLRRCRPIRGALQWGRRFGERRSEAVFGQVAALAPREMRRAPIGFLQ